MNKKKITLFTFCLLLNVGITGFAASLPTDVSENFWAKEDIKIAERDNWIILNNQKFNPNQAATRESVVHMLVTVWPKLLENNRTNYPLIQSTEVLYFTDVGTISPQFKTSVEVAYRNGLIKGYGNGTLKPMGNITRAEFTTILGRVPNNILDAVSSVSFKDTIPEWAKSYVEIIAKKGIIKGYEDGTFRSSNTITNAEALVMIKRWVYGDVSDIDTALEQSLANAKFAVVENNSTMGTLTQHGGNYNIKAKIISYAKQKVEYKETFDYKKMTNDSAIQSYVQGYVKGTTLDFDGYVQLMIQECKDFVKNQIVKSSIFYTNQNLVFERKDSATICVRGMIVTNQTQVKNVEVQMTHTSEGYKLDRILVLE